MVEVVVVGIGDAFQKMMGGDLLNFQQEDEKFLCMLVGNDSV